MTLKKSSYSLTVCNFYLPLSRSTYTHTQTQWLLGRRNELTKPMKHQNLKMLDLDRKKINNNSAAFMLFGNISLLIGGV